MSAKIAMTSPVVMSGAGTGSSSAVGGGCDVSFVMPSTYKSLSELPVPNDPNVVLQEVPPRYEVVMACSHRSFPAGDEFRALSARLLADAQAAGYVVIGAPPTRQSGSGTTQAAPSTSSASVAPLAKGYAYDPPWTPPFMRRNELAFEVEPPPLAAAAAALD